MNNKGFTLVEALIVLTLSTLVTVLIASALLASIGKLANQQKQIIEQQQKQEKLLEEIINYEN